MNNLIAISIGDINGLGIHLLIKEWKKGNIKNFIVITNYSIFKKNKFLSENFINLIQTKTKINQFKSNKFNIFNFNTKNQYTNALDSLNLAYKFTKEKIFIGIITLPLNKNDINKYVNKKFIDQTNFFSKLEKIKYSNMIFIHNKLIITPLTTHIELKKVPTFFKNNKIDVYNKILNFVVTLKKDFRINKPKIAIAGINPHSGENGLISEDEIKYLIPVIKKLKKNKINIKGPFSGDSIINKFNLNYFDAFIFTFHDQALIPFKILSNFEGVNFTGGLNIIRLSPSHGTARDLINNNNNASSKGLLKSFFLINQIYRNRKKFD